MLLMIKKKQKEKEEEGGETNIEKISECGEEAHVRIFNSLKESRLSYVVRKNLSRCFYKKRVSHLTFKTFSKKEKKKSFIRNGQVLTYPAGVFCLLKAAPLQQLVGHEIFRHSGNNTEQ